MTAPGSLSGIVCEFSNGRAKARSVPIPPPGAFQRQEAPNYHGFRQRADAHHRYVPRNIASLRSRKGSGFSAFAAFLVSLRPQVLAQPGVHP